MTRKTQPQPQPQTDNPADVMRNLLQALNARYHLTMGDGGAVAARPYANVARVFARACEEWADICDGYASVQGCNRCGRQRRCHVFPNGAALCRHCVGLATDGIR